MFWSRYREDGSATSRPGRYRGVLENVDGLSGWELDTLRWKESSCRGESQV